MGLAAPQRCVMFALMNDGASSIPPARRANDLRVLEQVSTELNSQHELERLVELLMAIMERVFGVQHCSVYLAEADEPHEEAPRAAVSSPALELVGRHGPKGREPHRVRVGQGIVGAAGAKREVVRLNYRQTALPLAQQSAIVCHLAVPMLAQGELVGVLKLEALRDGVLSKADEQLAGIIANQAAVAIENARLYEAQERLNAELELRVRERTAELEERHHELQQAQAQLLQSGKLAALGQLAAGLTHEINTPLGAIQASVSTAERALALLRAAPTTEDSSTKARGKADRALGALEQSNALIQQACRRVFGVFDTLRRFARLDESAHKSVQLHEGLDATLELLAHRIEGRVELVRHYGELPDVRCRPGEINQVFLIVITNALDALDAIDRSAEDQRERPLTLTLTTRHEQQAVVIEIADSGVGIADEQLERIFDPGFTTKGQRVSAGLSLAAAYRIVDEHGGTIAVESALGQGSCVRLRLPLDPGRQNQGR
jgi:signal transduction histidine kinase